jgi:hypothetical protein
MKTTTLESRQIDIEFLFIDLTTCTRCRGTDANLARALESVTSVLSASGATVNLTKVLVESPEKAREHRLVSSPTIRVNGQDVALGTKESRCGSCGDVAGQATDCRVWVYEGKEYTEAPEALLVDAVLRSVYGPAAPTVEPGSYPGVPENLVRFFEAKKANGGGPCCPTVTEGPCCDAQPTTLKAFVAGPQPASCGCA